MLHNPADIGQVLGISVILQPIFPNHLFHMSPMTRKIFSPIVLLLFRRTTKEDISRWLIPNPTQYMSSIRG